MKYARAVDVLVHEVAAATEADLKESPLSRSIVAHHTNALEAAEIFREAAPKLAVFSHIVLRGAATERDVLRTTRGAYRGEVVMGEDLMAIDVATLKVLRERRRAD